MRKAVISRTYSGPTSFYTHSVPRFSVIKEGITFDAENGDLAVTGVVTGDNAIDCNGNFTFGLQNEGTLTSAKSITADTIINIGSLTAGNITLTKTGPDAYFMNTGELTPSRTPEVVINGSINVDSNGWVNNTRGAVMTLNGQNAVIGAELANDYGAVLNINGDTTIERSLWNVADAVLNIADGVTVTAKNGFANGGWSGTAGGIVNAGGATIVVADDDPMLFNLVANGGTMTIGSVKTESMINNSGTLTVNQLIEGSLTNSGTTTYNGTETIQGSLQNSGTLYATTGHLTVDERITILKGSDIKTTPDQALSTLTGNDAMTVFQGAVLNVADAITVVSIENTGAIQTGTLTATEGFDIWHTKSGDAASITVDELILGGEYSSTIGQVRDGSRAYGKGELTVHRQITFLDNATLVNYGQIYFDGGEAVISGDGTLQNISLYWKEPGVNPSQTTNGLIAKNAERDPIEHLTVLGELQNNGDLYADTLSVAAGYDDDGEGEDGGDAAHVFQVKNLEVLSDGQFALKSQATTLETVTLRAGSALDGTETALELEGAAAITAEQSASAKLQTVSAQELSVNLDGGAVSIASLTNAKTLSVEFSELENSQLTVGEAPQTMRSSAHVAGEANNMSADEVIDAVNDAIDGIAVDKLTADPGEVTNGFTVDPSDPSTMVVTRNPEIDALSSLQALSLMQWRHEMNDLTKRMGELRDGAAGIGSWIRLYGSEQEYGAQNITMKNASVQIGLDTDIGANWKVGAAFSYTDGSSTYDHGDADHEAWSGALYGTWLAENGQFVDLTAKISRLKTDFNVSELAGNYDANAWSVSAEYGWHWRINDLFFLEPQVELTYGQVGGERFSAGNGIRVKTDDFTSFIGRAGLRAGVHLPDNKGVLYARISGLYDFDGETSLTAAKGTSNTMKEDLGGGWMEIGIGANFNVTKSDYVYVDLERTNGGEIVENWRWNIGLRHVW